MFTTEGATRSTALTTAREYSSKSAASVVPVAVPLPARGFGFASLSKNSGRAACLKSIVVITSKISDSPIHSSTTGRSNLYLLFGVLLSAGAWIKRTHGQSVVSSLSLGTAMPVTPSARPDCRQMDCARYSNPGARHDALCPAATRDRGDFAKDAHPDFAKPRARRPRPTQSASCRAAESGILT